MKWSSSHQLDVSRPEFLFGNLRLEPDGTLRRGETMVHLAPKEESALRLLLEHAGQIVTPAELQQSLWPDVHVTPDSVSRCLSSLRSRLEPDDCIQTIYKRGYRLKGAVQKHNGVQVSSLPRLAIVPFAVGQNVPEYLGPAIAEETAARLTAGQASRMSILARDSVFTLARKGLTAQQIGEALGADLVLAGTLAALPVCYRLRVEMIRAAEGTQIWVEDMLVRRESLASLEAELAGRLVFRISNGALPPDAWMKESPAGTMGNAEAYEDYLRGHQEWQALERHSMQDGAQRLAHAVELDPKLLPAKVDLAHACVTEALFGFMAPLVAAGHVRRIAETIPDLHDSAPALLPALGWIGFHADHDLAAALHMFSLSAHLGHSLWTTRLRVMLALSRHRFEEAGAWLQSALEEDPHAPWLHACQAWTLHLAGRREESLSEIDAALERNPEEENAQLFGAIILAFQGETERAVALSTALTQRMPYFDIATAAHAYALARAGRKQEAEGLRERLQWFSRERFVLSSFTPAVCMALDDPESALANLRAAEEARCPWFFQTLADPRLARLRDRAEFQEMLGLLAHMEDAAAEPAGEQ